MGTKKLKSRQNFDLRRALVAITIFAAVGVTLLLISKAATVNNSFEAESGQLSGNATAVPGEPNASNNSAVKFSASGGSGGSHGGAGLPFIDPNKIPGPNTAEHTAKFRITDAGDGATPVDYNADVGAFRTACRYSHTSYDDPIVYPGQPGAAHLHVFFGNEDANYASTANSIQNSGRSSCDGGTANRTAYWIPAMIDTRDGSVVLPVKQVDSTSALQIYYKSGYGFNDTFQRHDSIEPFPAGLKMIAGNSNATTSQGTGITNWSCYDAADSDHIPTNCNPGARIIMSIEFPSCWDGVNLDSANHQSHMAYPNGGCPGSHPHRMITITERISYIVPQGGTSTWRLASDRYTNGPFGYSAHADWFGGWDRNTLNKIVTDCMRPSTDCKGAMFPDHQILNIPYGIYGDYGDRDFY